MNSWKPITYVTDVKSLYIYEWHGKRYFFFGDMHGYRLNGGCQEQHHIECDDYQDNFKTIQYHGTECTSIGALLHNWFVYNNDHNIDTDFYLEEFFTKVNDRNREHE